MHPIELEYAGHRARFTRQASVALALLQLLGAARRHLLLGAPTIRPL